MESLLPKRHLRYFEAISLHVATTSCLQCVIQLKPYHKDMEEPSHIISKRAPTAITLSFDEEAACILADRTVCQRGVPPSRSTWSSRRTYWIARLLGTRRDLVAIQGADSKVP
ncbi:hypothetical protein AMTR_s00036p00097140 [Amborella trichopoda]|uniref:Uncharacterized protein n=1 Tax=Amborella trichopoda TaxID=13333 RepID=U5CZA8_AMBTC|nr:hypothetical protein AMTR_s00036p00097140 [Amborella trichopoda]